MAAIEQRLIEKLEKLPREHLADALARLDALNASPLSDEQIATEVRASREERRSGAQRRT